MKKLWIAMAILVGIGLGAGGVQLLTGSSNAAACSGRNPGAESHSIMIMDGKVEPANTTAKLCDTITFTNMDDMDREIAFGPHDEHVPYDGIAADHIGKDKSFTITANEVGTYHFHDHEHDEVEGYFTVTK